MYTNSAIVDMYYHKIWDSNSFCKYSYENTKFRLHMHLEDKIHGSAYANKICYFHMIFCKTNLNLKFCDNVYLQMH